MGASTSVVVALFFVGFLIVAATTYSWVDTYQNLVKNAQQIQDTMKKAKMQTFIVIVNVTNRTTCMNITLQNTGETTLNASFLDTFFNGTYYNTYNQPSGLAAYWKFDENTGTSASDSSGNGNTGTIYNATWTAGMLCSALKFNGTNNSYIEGNDSASLDVNNITIMAWINPANVTNNHSIAGKVGGYDFKLNGSNLGFSIPNGTNITTTGANILANTWSHVAVTYNGSVAIFYKNGNVVNSTSLTNPLLNGNVFRIGKNQWNEAFNGTIDDVKIYNRALTASEINAEYSAISSVTIPVNTWPPLGYINITAPVNYISGTRIKVVTENGISDYALAP